MAQRPPSFQERNTYIPPSVRTAMDHHMQQSMPAHLKQYAGGDKYIPQHAQAAMSKHMEKSMPGHLKQYSGAYMQQKTFNANSRPVGSNAQFNPVAPPTPYKPVNYLPRDSHYYQYGDPSQIQPGQTPPSQQPPTPAPQPSVTYPTYQPQSAPPQTQAPAPPQNPGLAGGYDFIMNPDQPTQNSFLGGASKLAKFGLIAGGLAVVLIIFTVIRGLFSEPSILPSYISIAQDQQELIHIVEGAKKQKDLTRTNQNFVATAGLSLPSNQSELLKLLGESGAKSASKSLGAKISAATDQRLASAAAATTYNQTFKEIMAPKLKTYMSHMQQTYDKSKGKASRDLLSKQYAEAELLLKQLETLDTSD